MSIVITYLSSVRNSPEAINIGAIRLLREIPVTFKNSPEAIDIRAIGLLTEIRQSYCRYNDRNL